MALLDRVLDRFLPPRSPSAPPSVPQASLENPAVPLSQALDLLTWGSRGNNYGPVVTPAVAMSVPAVFRAVTLRAGAIGAMPLKVYRRTPTGGREEVPNHPVAKLLRNGPNPKLSLTSTALMEWVVTSVDLTGQAYCLVRYSNAAKVVGLEPVATEHVTVLRNPQNGRLVYDVAWPERAVERVDQEDMLHFRGPPGLDGVMGLSKIEMGRDVIALSKVLEQRVAEAHANAASPSGLMLVPKMAADAFKRFKAQFLSEHTGAGSAGRVIFADSDADFKPIALTSQQLSTNEQRIAVVIDIARLFSIPNHLLMESSGSTSWGSGIAEITGSWLAFSLNADLSRIEAEVNRVLLGGDLFCEFQRLNLLQLDPIRSAEVMRIQLSAGLLKVNEGRAALNLPPDPDGDHLYVNSASVLLSTLVNPPAPVAAPPPGSDPKAPPADKSTPEETKNEAQ